MDDLVLVAIITAVLCVVVALAVRRLAAAEHARVRLVVLKRGTKSGSATSGDPKITRGRAPRDTLRA